MEDASSENGPRSGQFSEDLMDFENLSGVSSTQLDSQTTFPSVDVNDTDPSALMGTRITGDLALIRNHVVQTVTCTPAARTGDIKVEPMEYFIPQVDSNTALRYVSANWSSMLYISSTEMISFGGYDEDMKTPHDKVVWFDLANMTIAEELSPMKVSRFAPVIILVGELVYVFGGGFDLPIDCTRVEAERYNIRTKSWEDLPNLTYPKRTANPSHYHGIIYLVGGLGSPQNEAYRIPQGDYIPLDITYPMSLKHPGEGIRSISYIVGNELVLLNSNFLQVFALEPVFAYKTYEVLDLSVNVRSAVSPVDQGNLVYSVALFIHREARIRRNLFCIFEKDTRKFYMKMRLEICGNAVHH